jgi:hypothetical protein
MSKAQSLVKKAAVFEKLARYGSRKDFLHSLAEMDLAAQQEAFNKAKKSFNDAMNNVRKYSTNLDSETQSAFSAIPTSVPNNADDLLDAADKLGLFGKKLYLLGKKENNRDKMVAANAIWYASSEMRTQIDLMRGAWPVPPGGEEEEADLSPGGNADPSAYNFAPQEITRAPLSVLQSVKTQVNLINNLANGLKGKAAPAKAQSLKQINNAVLALQKALKNRNWGAIKDYIIGRKLITDSLQSLYNDKLEYDDLALVPALDYGRGVPEAAY